MSSVNCLGAGVASMVDALQNGRGGLTPCRFDVAAALPTFVGEVQGLEAVRIRQDLQSYDCRNNRIAQLALDAG